jgi:hypothetical protein
MHAILAAWARYEVTFRGGSDAYQEGLSELEQLIGILRLAKSSNVRAGGLWGHSIAAQSAEIGGRIPRARGAPWIISSAEAANLHALFSATYPITVDQMMITWSRFNSYFSRLDDQDAFIDLMVALEAAFGDGGEAIRYKIALRAALFVEGEDQDRRATYKFLTDAYVKRSGVLHGSSDARDWASSNLSRVEDLVRRTLVRLAKLSKAGAVPSGSDWDAYLFWPST